MSDAEPEVEVPAADLPESAVTAVVEAISQPVSVHVVNDVEVATAVDSAQKLNSISATAADRANEHMIAEITREDAASESFGAAENAKTENGYHAFIGSGELHEVIAESHNVAGNAAAARSEETGAAASAMERIATVQIAAQEIAERTIFAVQEVADRTTAGVQQEIKAVQAAAEDTGGPSQDLETELVAQAELGGPKV